MSKDDPIEVGDDDLEDERTDDEAPRPFLLGDLTRSAVAAQVAKSMQDVIESSGVAETRRQILAAGTSLVEAARGPLPFATPTIDLARHYKALQLTPVQLRDSVLAAAGLDESVIPGLAGAQTWREKFGAIDSDIFKTVVPDAISLRSITDELIQHATFDGFQSAAFTAFADEQENIWERIAPGLRDLSHLIYPHNLREIEDLTFEEVETVTMVDGIALYCVPRQSIAEALVRAEGSQKRREILGRRWKQISADCREVVDGLDDRLKDYRRAVTVALDALDAGHVDAAQALAASAIDSFMNVVLKGYEGLKPNGKVRTNDAYNQLSMQRFIAFAPIWQAYQLYRVPHTPVPMTFSRHATAHTVSPRQFNRRNAVQALLLASGLLYHLDEQIAKTR